jgi:hypothetical protein
MRPLRWPFLARSAEVVESSLVGPFEMVPRSLRHQESYRWRSIARSVVTSALVLFLLVLVLILDFQLHLPSRDTTSIDQLVDQDLSTFKYAIVEHGEHPYVVWIGPIRAPCASGPPVYVFDGTGGLVDRTSDVGEFVSPFVDQLYDVALDAPPITGEMALNYCRHNRMPS